jgi:hypothetical protein
VGIILEQAGGLDWFGGSVFLAESGSISISVEGNVQWHR